MSARLLYGILLICSMAMLLFVAGFACLQLGLGFLTALIYAVAGKIMLLGFGLLLLLGAAALIAALLRDLRDYFRQEAVAIRRLWAVQAQQIHIDRKRALESRQLRYLNQFKRRRLLAANDKKHLRALYDAIHRELQAVKNRMPAASYQAMCKALRNHLKQADAEAMLALRRQIPCR